MAMLGLQIPEVVALIVVIIAVAYFTTRKKRSGYVVLQPPAVTTTPKPNTEMSPRVPFYIDITGSDRDKLERAFAVLKQHGWKEYVTSRTNLITTGTVRTRPYAWPYKRIIVFTPRSLTKYSDEEIREVLLHEASHIRSAELGLPTRGKEAELYAMTATLKYFRENGGSKEMISLIEYYIGIGYDGSS